MNYLHVLTIKGVDLAHLDGLLLYVKMGLFQLYEENGLPIMEAKGSCTL